MERPDDNGTPAVPCDHSADCHTLVLEMAILALEQATLASKICSAHLGCMALTELHRTFQAACSDFLYGLSEEIGRRRAQSDDSVRQAGTGRSDRPAWEQEAWDGYYCG